MPGIINNPDTLGITLEGKDVEIVESFLISEESSCEWTNSRVVGIFGLFMADHIGCFPNVDTFNNMGVIPGILHIVDDSLLTEFWHDLCVEEDDIAHSEVKVDFGEI